MSLSYPVHLRLDGRRVLVAGAGQVATRKIQRLSETGAELFVVAMAASAPVERLAAEGRITLSRRAVQGDDARGAFLVLAATSDTTANAKLARDARAQGALVSRVDDPHDSDFTIPALARGSSVEATVSTFGTAPSASRRLGRELRTWIAHGVDRFAGEVARARTALAGTDDASLRLRRLGDGELFDACVRGDEARIRELVEGALHEPSFGDSP
jgi:precorrin-2 dehydrogenase/sirohydrochlorin ferrochelatase